MELLELAELMKSVSKQNPMVLKYEESESHGYGYDGTSYETTYLRVIGAHEKNGNVLLKCDVSVKCYEFHEYMGKVKKSPPTIEYHAQFCATRRYAGLSFVPGNRMPTDVIAEATAHLKRKMDETTQTYDKWVKMASTL